MKDSTEAAIDYIITCCPSAGGFAGTSDVDNFLKKVKPNQFRQCHDDILQANDYTE